MYYIYNIKKKKYIDEISFETPTDAYEYIEYVLCEEFEQNGEEYIHCMNRFIVINANDNSDLDKPDFGSNI